MLELITSNHVLVERSFPNFREAITEAKAILNCMCWVRHVWIRKKGNTLMLARVTPKETYFSHLTSIPTELL